MQHVRGTVLDQDDEESDEKITKDFYFRTYSALIPHTPAGFKIDNSSTTVLNSSFPVGLGISFPSFH